MEENLDKFDYMIINVEYLLNGSLNNKVNKIIYDPSINGREISYLGSAFIVVYQGGALGAAIYFVNSTQYVFQYTKISDTLTNYPVTFSSVDKNTGTFNIAWGEIKYAVILIPLVESSIFST